MVFDYRVRWSDHVGFSKDKIHKYIYAFRYRQLIEILVHREIILAYYAYTQSLLFLRIIAWGGAQKSILSTLIITKKYILKVGLKNAKYFPLKLFSERPMSSPIPNCLFRNFLLTFNITLGKFLQDALKHI